MLGATETPLCEAYDLAMLDLDGVVYIDGRGVPGAAESIAAVRNAGMHVAFITNNASRPAAAVADRLTGLSVPAEASDVVTSSQAAAHLLRERHGAGAPVALLGAEGLARALADEELCPVEVDDETAVCIVTGYGPDVPWRDVMRAAVRIRDGLPWVATNTDRTFPTAYGAAPGHGVLVETLRSFSGVDPVVAGKPQRPLLDETVRRVGGQRPLMVGDRLDTDIAGAVGAGLDSLLVLTGVSGLAEVVAAGRDERPTYLAGDLAGLLAAHPVPEERDGRWWLGGLRAGVEAGRLVVEGTGSPDDWWRVAASAAWEHLDRTGAPADVDDVEPPTR